MSIPDYKAVWIASAPRTGSMWAWNVARRLLILGGRTLVEAPPGLSEQERGRLALDTIYDGPPQAVACFKTHEIIRLDLPRTRLIITLRDPRDAAYSFCRFVHAPLSHMERQVEAVMRITDYYVQAPDPMALKLRYTDIVARPRETITAIAAFLGMAVSQDQCLAIADSLTPEAVKAVIAGVEQEALRKGRPAKGEFIHNHDGTIRIVDPETQFQTGHVSGLGDGQWRGALDAKQLAALEALIGPWLRRHGFATDPA